MIENIKLIIEGDYTTLQIELILIGLCWAMMIIAVLIDLWTGIERARKCGEKIKSHKLRDTLIKVSEYWRVMIFGLFIDAVCFIIIPHPVPFGSGLFMLACCGIEGKSVIENLKRKKAAAAEIPKTVIDILKSLDNPEKLKMYIEVANELNHKHKEEENANNQ